MTFQSTSVFHGSYTLARGANYVGVLGEWELSLSRECQTSVDGSRSHISGRVDVGEGSSLDDILSVEDLFVYTSSIVSRECRSGTVIELKAAYSNGAARNKKSALTGMCNA